MNFNHYFTNSELEKVLIDFKKKFPHLFELEKIGKSHEGRPLWLATLTNKKTGDPGDKSALWLDANIHSVELAGTTVVLYIINKLLQGYGKSPSLRRLMDNHTFYCVPRINPDGVERALAKNPQFTRSGVRPYPIDQQKDGLRQKDINEDGLILQMRFEDPAGDWKVSSLDTRLLERRQPHDNQGPFFRILPEGILNNFDGDLIRIPPNLEGLDFNRNFPSRWRPEAEQTGAGPFPTSEPEIKSIVDFVSKHPNINIALSYHTYGGQILRPFGDRCDDKIDTDDLWLFQKLGKHGSKLTGYQEGSAHTILRYNPKEIMTGTANDWFYEHFGILSWVIEIWDMAEMAGVKRENKLEWDREHPHEHDIRILKWADKNAGKNAYIKWSKYDHPQLGKVEIGGWNFLYTWRNPPAKLMSAEAEKNSAFVLSLAETLPLLKIRRLECRKLGNDLFKVNLVVENLGFLPTFTTRQAKKMKCVAPVEARLKLPAGAQLEQGERKTELGFIEGRSLHMEMRSYGLMGTPTDNRAKAQWVIRSKAGSKIELEIYSPRSGRLRTSQILA